MYAYRLLKKEIRLITVIAYSVALNHLSEFLYQYYSDLTSIVEIPYDKAVLLCQGQRQEKLENCKFEGCSLDYTDTIQIKTDGMFIGVGHIQKGVLISDRMMSDPLHTNLGLYKD